MQYYIAILHEPGCFFGLCECNRKVKAMVNTVPKQGPKAGAEVRLGDPCVLYGLGVSAWMPKEPGHPNRLQQSLEWSFMATTVSYIPRVGSKESWHGCRMIYDGFSFFDLGLEDVMFQLAGFYYILQGPRLLPT